MTTLVSVQNATKTSQAAIIATALDNGNMVIYSGTPPADADTALSGNTVLANFDLSSTAIATNVNGLLTFNTITQNGTNAASGTATFYRMRDSGNNTIFQGTVATSGGSLTLDSVLISQGGTISIPTFTHQVGQ